LKLGAIQVCAGLAFEFSRAEAVDGASNPNWLVNQSPGWEAVAMPVLHRASCDDKDLLVEQ
jgi:hypothetical protein